jgi:hypothetical protein
MRRVVGLFKKYAKDQLLWTYVINLGQDGSHPSVLDFKEEALRLAILDNLGDEQTLIIKIREIS